MICDLCGSPDATELFTSGDRRFGLEGAFSITRCTRCRLVRTEPQPDDLSTYYPSDSYYSFRAPEVPPLTAAIVRRAYCLEPRGGPVVRLAATLLGRRLGGLPPGPPGELLDVGCGSGGFLLALEDAGWRCSGVEIDAGAVAAARAAGLERVRQGDLLEAGYDDASMDVVRFSHSLEHLRSPRAALAEAHRILRTGGRLVVSVPNFASLLSRVFRDRWFFLDVPRHLWHFDRARLRALAAETDFEVQRIRNVTASSAILGTLDYLRGRRETLVESRLAWYAAQPLAAALDAVRLGDELELVAVKRA